MLLYTYVWQCKHAVKRVTEGQNTMLADDNVTLHALLQELTYVML